MRRPIDPVAQIDLINASDFVTLPPALAHAETPRLVGRYYILNQRKRAIEVQIGEHPPGGDPPADPCQTEGFHVETDESKRAELKASLQPLVREMVALQLELDRRRSKVGTVP